MTSTSRPGRWTVAAGAILIGSLLAVAGPASLALAQSPTPTVNALDIRPSVFDKHPTGVVVEAVGSGRCAYPWSSAKSATVRYIRAKKPVWTEVSPQSACASLSGYKSMIHSLITYVRARVPNLAAKWWAGVMLDEEPNFGFSASQVISLNKYVQGQVVHLPGVTFVFTEDATWSGAWSQSQYDRIVAPTDAAPQIYNSYMVKIANRAKEGNTLVTWTATAQHPFNSWKYTVGKIKGAPYEGSFGSKKKWKWSNQWQSQ
jgi:hypothetical protein